jgi:chromosome segregation ATPase
MNPTSSLPPLADPALITLAAQLLAALSDPEGTKARLGALADAQDAFQSAKLAHDDAADQARHAAASLSDLKAREKALADKQAEHERSATALAVASEANARRGRDLDERERALEAQASDLQRRTSAFDARVKAFRDELAG